MDYKSSKNRTSNIFKEPKRETARLLVLPLDVRTEKKFKSAATKMPTHNQSTQTYEDFRFKALRLAMREVDTVINLIRQFIGEPIDEFRQIDEWLFELEAEMGILQEMLKGRSTEDNFEDFKNEAIELAETLRKMPFAEDFIENDLPINDVLIRFTDFWLKEASRRGWDVYYICIVALGLDEVIQTLTIVDNLRYPFVKLEKISS